VTGSRILVVEDDAAIRRGLVDALKYAGHQVVECADGDAGHAAIAGVELDLALLDVVLPGRSGLDLLEEIRRRHPDLPVILVTARGAERDRVTGLENGADDYVVKPFSARELLARVDAVLRRTAVRSRAPEVLELHGRRIDLGTRQVELPDGGRAALSEKEAAILRYLAGVQGRPVPRDELLERVWGLDPQGLTTRTVDMHIARLREKLGDHDVERPLILTVRSKGYLLGGQDGGGA